MPQRKINRALTAGIIAAIILAGLSFFSERRPFSPHQPFTEMQAQYSRCKANAPEGFDCVAVFMLVSDTFIKEEFGEQEKE